MQVVNNSSSAGSSPNSIWGQQFVHQQAAAAAAGAAAANNAANWAFQQEQQLRAQQQVLALGGQGRLQGLTVEQVHSLLGNQATAGTAAALLQRNQAASLLQQSLNQALHPYNSRQAAAAALLANVCPCRSVSTCLAAGQRLLLPASPPQGHI